MRLWRKDLSRALDMEEDGLQSIIGSRMWREELELEHREQQGDEEGLSHRAE